LERAAQLVLRARCFYDIWRYFEEAKARQSALDAMQEYCDFFRFDIEANFCAFIVHLVGLFEGRRDTINFHQLAIEAELDIQSSIEVRRLLDQSRNHI